MESYIGNNDLIIIDNIFSLYTSGRENDADSWIGYNEWSRKLRGKGRSVLWLHHTGKDKTRGPRGSSAIESILNCSMALEVSCSHKAHDGAEVTVSYHKSRGVAGEDVKDFGAKLETIKNSSGETIGLKWVLIDTQQEFLNKKIQYLHDTGLTLSEIAEEVGISKSNVQRRLKIKS